MGFAGKAKMHADNSKPSKSNSLYYRHIGRVENVYRDNRSPQKNQIYTGKFDFTVRTSNWCNNTSTNNKNSILSGTNFSL